MSSRRPILPIVTALLHLTVVLLVLVALLSPAPISFSEVGLFSITPIDLNSTSSSYSQAGLVNGGATSNNTSSVNTTSTPAPPTTTSSAPANSSATSRVPPQQSVVPYGSATTFSASGTAVNTTATSGTYLPTPIAIKMRRIVRRELQSRTITSATSTAPAQREFSAASLSKIRLVFGPLGSCFTNARGTKMCTSAKLSPSFDSTGLIDPTVGRFNIDGLPTTMSTTPVLLLVALCCMITSTIVFIMSSVAEVFPVPMSSFLEGGSRARMLLSTRQYSLWLMMATSLLYLIASIALRIFASRAVNAFNSANDGIAMMVSATIDGRFTSVGLQAGTGKTFGILWTSAGLLTILTVVERKRLHNAAAVQQARADIEALHGRMAFEGKIPMQRQQSMGAPSVYSAEPYSHSAFSHSAVSVADVHRAPSPAPTQRTYHEQDTDMYQRPYTYGRTPCGHGQTYQPDPYIVDALYQGRRGDGRLENGHSEAMSWRLIGDQSGQVYN